jgi:hypothetical protein
VTSITKLGGNAEGAYLASDGSGQLVVKAGDAPDRTVLAYNLAKDFKVDIPSSRYLPLDSPEGAGLLSKAKDSKVGNSDLAKSLAKVKAAILMALVEGKTLGKLKGLSGETSEDVQKLQSDPENLKTIGRMVVYDATILNADRFKLEFNAPANSGNLMVSQGRPVGIDQDFAKLGDEDALEDYKDMFVSRLKGYIANPAKFAADLVEKMKAEGYALFANAEKFIEQGIIQGVDILKGLAKDSNTRLEKLVEWAHTFVSASTLKTKPIREYWKELLED